MYILQIAGSDNKFDNMICDMKSASLFTSREFNQGRRNNGRAGKAVKS